jgi:hypothetical protein
VFFLEGVHLRGERAGPLFTAGPGKLDPIKSDRREEIILLLRPAAGKLARPDLRRGKRGDPSTYSTHPDQLPGRLGRLQTLERYPADPATSATWLGDVN